MATREDGRKGYGGKATKQINTAYHYLNPKTDEKDKKKNQLKFHSFTKTSIKINEKHHFSILSFR